MVGISQAFRQPFSTTFDIGIDNPLSGAVNIVVQFDFITEEFVSFYDCAMFHYFGNTVGNTDVDSKSNDTFS